MKKFPEELVEAIRIDYETTLESNPKIEEKHRVSHGSVSRLALARKWKRREDYVACRATNHLPYHLIEHARSLYVQNYRMADIAEAVGRSVNTIGDWKRRFGWPQRDGVAEPRKYNSNHYDDGWPKVTAEWPPEERFDTPGRHYHDLDKTLRPVFIPAAYPEAV